MRPRLPSLVCALTALALCAAGGSASADDRVIADGVTAGGVDLGGLTVDAAAARLDSVLTPHLQRDVVLGAGGRAYRLSMTDARLRFDALRTAQRAAHEKPGPAPAGGGAVAGVVVPLALSHARLAVRAWVARTAARAYRSPRDATLRIGVRHMRLRGSRSGHALDATATAAAIDAAIDDGSASRVLHQRLLTLRPRVTATGLRRAYRTIITVDRSTYTLRLFKGLRIRRRYGVAVGRAGLETPAGRYAIHDRQVNPAWHVPNSAWAGSLAGKVIPGGAPDNPLKARWLGIANGVGIHGTAEEWSVGSSASHGCIRMRVRDVLDLYPRVPLGTTVLIH